MAAFFAKEKIFLEKCTRDPDVKEVWSTVVRIKNKKIIVQGPDIFFDPWSVPALIS